MDIFLLLFNNMIGFFPIIIYVFYIYGMDVWKMLQKYSGQPLTHQLLLSSLKEYKRPNDKIHELMANGILFPIKKGLYIPGFNLNIAGPEPFLLANHILGPSYVSLESALSFHGLIPERVFGVSSVTTKASRHFQTSLGEFSYKRLSLPYYSFGIQHIKIAEKQFVLMASPEKALCDKVFTTAGVILRSKKNTMDYLNLDLRVDVDQLNKLDTSTMREWLSHTPKRNSLFQLIKTIEAI